jgi:hypothetical protein
MAWVQEERSKKLRAKSKEQRAEREGFIGK